ncbi:hypothetical protein F4778DRAFT_734341 [Xylariomycetidae sp. FL2044]|nr:hypothetical protein F4778DRAFT_734341 [Xylariomycetidae sp. FL2044]
MSLDQISSLSLADQSAILNGAALTPPGDTVSNFENPDNENGLTHFAVAICLIVSTFGMLTRGYSRIVCVKRVEIEDYFAFAAYGLYIGYIYITYWLLDSVGFFVHQWDIRVKDFTTVLYIVHVGTDLYSVVMMLMKGSILREWVRIFVPRGTRGTFFWTCCVVMVMNAAFYSAILFVDNLSCFPHQRIWDKTVPGSVCLDTRPVSVAAACVNVVLDFFTFLVPQKVIWSLQMSIQKKIGVALLFAFGLLACAAAAARIAYSLRYYTSDDTAYTLSAVSLWAIAEMTCMFLVFCGPATPKVIKSFKSNTDSTKPLRSTSPRSDGAKKKAKYRMIDENGVPLTHITSMGGLPSSTKSTREIEPSAGIIRTQEFTSGEIHDDRYSGNSEFIRQHPWTST